MAITRTSVQDTATLARAVLIFVLAGALAGAGIGWHRMPTQLGEAEEAYATRYTVGRVLDGLGIDRMPSGHILEPVLAYRTINQAYPVVAQRIEAATFSALAWPWSVLGALAGLGLLTLFSRFNDFMSKRKKS